MSFWESFKKLRAYAAQEEPEPEAESTIDETLISLGASDYVWRLISRLDSEIFRELCEQAGPGGLVTTEHARAFLDEHLRFKGEPFA